MISHLAFIRRSVLAAALVLLAAGTGCGGGGYQRAAGTLEVANNAFSGDILDSMDVDEVGGPDHFVFNVGLFPGEVFDVDLFPDSYDVTIFWHDGSVDFHTVYVYDGTVTVLNVAN